MPDKVVKKAELGNKGAVDKKTGSIAIPFTTFQISFAYQGGANKFPIDNFYNNGALLPFCD